MKIKKLYLMSVGIMMVILMLYIRICETSAFFLVNKCLMIRIFGVFCLGFVWISVWVFVERAPDRTSTENGRGRGRGREPGRGRPQPRATPERASHGGTTGNLTGLLNNRSARTRLFEK